MVENPVLIVAALLGFMWGLIICMLIFTSRERKIEFENRREQQLRDCKSKLCSLEIKVENMQRDFSSMDRKIEYMKNV